MDVGLSLVQAWSLGAGTNLAPEAPGISLGPGSIGANQESGFSGANVAVG